MLKNYLAFFLLCCVALTAQAELSIEITKGVEGGGIPIAIPSFAQAGGLAENMAAIINADLARSGRFRIMPESEMLSQPNRPDQVDFRQWQAQGQENLVIGDVQQSGPGQYAVQFYLYDVLSGNQRITYRLPFNASAQELRRTAHRISDLIYQQLTGQPGVFTTKVAYITAEGADPRNRVYRLQIADADGMSPQTIITSPQPVMSPSWSPDGKQVAYVSFENRKAEIFVQTLTTGQRQKVSSTPGINGAPAWSPDGTQLAMTLSKDGNPEIYVLHVASGALRRLTNDSGIDTEPAWSRDGRFIFFTSDRGGRPQIYSLSAAGGQPQRLTHQGEYNARPIVSPDGRYIAMVQGGGGYHISILDLQSGQQRTLTKGPNDESPSFAPNGSMVLYATNGILHAVSIDGQVQQRLQIPVGEVREPAWSPL